MSKAGSGLPYLTHYSLCTNFNDVVGEGLALLVPPSWGWEPLELSWAKDLAGLGEMGGGLFSHLMSGGPGLSKERERQAVKELRELQRQLEQLAQRCRADGGADGGADEAPPAWRTPSWAAVEGVLAELAPQAPRGCWNAWCVGGLGGAEVKLSRCSVCRVACYCSAECQKRAWGAGHKQACKRLGRA